MLQSILAALLSCTIVLFNGCGEGQESPIDNNAADSSDLSLDAAQASETMLPAMVDVKLKVLHEGLLTAGDMTVNLACDNVFGGGATGDWTSNNVSTTSGSTVSVVAGKACRVTLVNYSDSSNTYSAVSSSLVVSISSSGVVTAASALQYTSGGGSPVLQWFAASSGGSYSIVFNYAADAITASTVTSATALTGQTITLTVAQVPAPTVSGLTVYNVPTLNGVAATYTLVVTSPVITGSISCKYILNNGNTYTATSWSSVNSAFNNVSAVACPQFIDGGSGFSVGNWTTNWNTGNTYLIMWANTVNNISSYTVANVTG